MTAIRAVAVLAAALLAAGCAARPPRAPLPALAVPARLAGVTTADSAPAVADRWWTAFGDPQLDALVDEALAGSPSVDEAAARLGAAAAVAKVARSGRLPQATFDASLDRERLSETGLYPPPYNGATVNLGQLGVDLSYEVDLTGRIRAAVAAGDAGVAAAAADLAAARIGLAAAVARAYLELGHNGSERATLREAAVRRGELLALTEQRARAGLDTLLEVEEARASVAAVDADLAENAEQEALLRNQLAALAGKGPGRGADLAAPAAQLPQTIVVPATLPANLVGRRADVAAERARVAVAAAEVKVAETAFYPNLNLGALLGVQSIELGSLLSAGARVWDVGPALSLPLFTAGRLRGELEGRDAEYRAAVARYNATVLGAYHEVADAAASLRALDREQLASDAALRALGHAFELARGRYRAGLNNYVTVLIAEDKLLAQRRIAVALDARRAELAVALFRALGGGFTS